MYLIFSHDSTRKKFEDRVYKKVQLNEKQREQKRRRFEDKNEKLSVHLESANTRREKRIKELDEEFINTLKGDKIYLDDRDVRRRQHFMFEYQYV